MNINMFTTCIYHNLCQLHNGSEDKCQGTKYGLEPCTWYVNIIKFKEEEKSNGRNVASRDNQSIY
jgi:hypothetical protein